jgi:hypothetical protein
MADNYIQDILARLVAMEKEALDTITSSAVDAVPFWPYEQESFPYFTNRFGAMTVNYDEYSEIIQEYGRTFLVQLVVDHWNAGFTGDKADLAVQYLVLTETYFRDHPRLITSAAGSYPNEPNYLFQEMQLIGDTGLVIFQNAGIQALQYGIEFTLSIPFMREGDL